MRLELGWQLPLTRCHATRLTLAPVHILDPILDDGLELSAKVRAVEAGLLDDGGIRVCLLVRAIPPHLICRGGAVCQTIRNLDSSSEKPSTHPLCQAAVFARLQGRRCSRT